MDPYHYKWTLQLLTLGAILATAGGRLLVNRYSQQCLADGATDEQYNTKLVNCSEAEGNNDYQWTFEKKRITLLVNTGTKRCLESIKTTTAVARKVRMVTCNEFRAEQGWKNVHGSRITDFKGNCLNVYLEQQECSSKTEKDDWDTKLKKSATG